MTQSRDLNVWCRPWHTNSQIFIFTAPKLRYLNHLLHFFHCGIPSFEILEGWSKGDPFKGTKGNWSTSVNQVGKEIKSLRNWVFVWLSTFTVPGKLKVVRIKIKYCWKDTRLCSGIQIVDLSPRNKEQLDAFKYQSGPRLVAGDCGGQTTGGVLFSNVTEETLNYQSWE